MLMSEVIAELQKLAGEFGDGPFHAEASGGWSKLVRAIEVRVIRRDPEAEPGPENLSYIAVARI